MGDRSAFRHGLEQLAELQRKLEYPPKRKIIPGLVEKLARDSGLEGDSRKHHFSLLAHCALLGKEPMHNEFKSRKKRGKEKGHKESHKDGSNHNNP